MVPNPPPVTFAAAGPVPHAVLPEPRLRVLEALTSRTAPATIAELTGALGGHPNTVRSHLHQLVDAGLVDRLTLETEGRGRPAHAYAATERGILSAEASRVARPVATDELISAVAEHLATTPDPEQHARAIGRIWAGQLLEDGSRPTGAQPADELVAMLTTAGFSPQVDSASSEIALRTCPVLDSAREHPEVVCTIHEGMLRAALDRSGAEAVAVQLLPFARPGACLVRLAT